MTDFVGDLKGLPDSEPPLDAPANAVQERTIEEIKVEAQARAERNGYPMIGLDPSDVRNALEKIHTREPEEWAAGWSAVAHQYEELGGTSRSGEERRKNYLRAWRLYHFAQWPVATCEGKRAAYGKALECFLNGAKSLDPPLEVVRIPFEGNEIIGYLRLPKSERPVPLVLAISGLDSRKENLANTYDALIEAGVGYLAVDGPGTGQSPIKAGPRADRIFSRALDYLATRKEIDPQRILAHGVSFGGYWASKLAIVEKERLHAAVVLSPPVHRAFQADFLRKSLFGNREYLFDQVPAFLNVWENTSSMDDLAQRSPHVSLQALGLLDKPMVPMLVVAGAKDTQVPFSDIALLLGSGQGPKEAWINSGGGHLGRDANRWSDPVIFRGVIVPWVMRALTG